MRFKNYLLTEWIIFPNDNTEKYETIITNIETVLSRREYSKAIILIEKLRDIVVTNLKALYRIKKIEDFYYGKDAYEKEVKFSEELYSRIYDINKNNHNLVTNIKPLEELKPVSKHP